MPLRRGRTAALADVARAEGIIERSRRPSRLKTMRSRCRCTIAMRVGPRRKRSIHGGPGIASGLGAVAYATHLLRRQNHVLLMRRPGSTRGAPHRGVKGANTQFTHAAALRYSCKRPVGVEIPELPTIRRLIGQPHGRRYGSDALMAGGSHGNRCRQVAKTGLYSDRAHSETTTGTASTRRRAVQAAAA